MGIFGAHRFYVGDAIQSIIDAFLLYYRIEDIKAQIEESIMTFGNKSGGIGHGSKHYKPF
nr:MULTISPECIES: hypothetical protein [Thermoactinomyces]